MASKPDSGPKLIHIVIPAVSTLLVALIGLGTAIFQSDQPIRLTQVAETALASTLTAGPLLQSLTPPAAQILVSSTTIIENTQPVETTSMATLTPSHLTTATRVPPPTDIPNTPPPTVTVQNELYLPIKVSIDNVYQDEIAPAATMTFSLDTSSATINWTVVKETTSSGRELGNDMDGIFKNVTSGDQLVIDNVIDDQHYFYPIITNPGSVDCDVTINKGWENEVVTNAIIPANTDKVGLGYYRLYTNSNVTLNCGGNMYWWGTLPNQGNPDSFYGEVDQQSGVIEWTLKP